MLSQMADKAFAFIPLELIYSSAHIGYGCICRKQLFFFTIFLLLFCFSFAVVIVVIVVAGISSLFRIQNQIKKYERFQ